MHLTMLYGHFPYFASFTKHASPVRDELEGLQYIFFYILVSNEVRKQENEMFVIIIIFTHCHYFL